MAKKLAGSNVPGISDPELLRPRVLKYLVELTDETPPLGERYEELLKDLIFEAYQTANGDLGENEKAFLDEVFHYATTYGAIEEFFEDPQISEIMVNGPDQIFVERHGKLLMTAAKYDSELQLRLSINHIINPFGRYVSYKHPMVDAHQIFVERHGKLLMTAAKYDSELQLRLSINHIINPFGRYVSYKHPMVDAHLKD